MTESAAMEVSTALFDLSRHSKKRNYIRRGRANSSSDSEIPPNFVTPPALLSMDMENMDMDIDTSSASAVAVPTFSSATAAEAEPELKEDAAIIQTETTTAAAAATAAAATSTNNIPESSDSEPGQLSLTEILRRRKKQARPKKGLDIAEVVPKISRDGNNGAATDNNNNHNNNNSNSPDGVVKDSAEQELAVVVNRFTHQTGHVLNVDKHMVAYIESEMEKRRRAKSSAGGGGGANTAITKHDSGFNPFQQPSSEHRKSAFWQPSRPGDRGATLGKLHEVDLGEENKIRNIHRTKEATRRLGGGQPMEDQLDSGPGKKKFRRRRRNSQDIQRDKLVEEVLKESKLQVELYDEPDGANEEEEEGAADDRIAEKFRREFLEALMSRRRRRGNYQKTKKKDETRKPRGPKLGGSRSARAAMRESQLAANGAAGGKREREVRK